MKHAWILAAALGGIALSAACSDDDTSSPTTATGTGGSAACFTPAGGYGPFGDVCMEEPSDNECLSCTRAECCTEAEACAPDSTCACLLECFLDGCDPIGCLQTCGQNDQVNALTQCASANCPSCLQ